MAHAYRLHISNFRICTLRAVFIVDSYIQNRLSIVLRCYESENRINIDLKIRMDYEDRPSSKKIIQKNNFKWPTSR